MTEREYATAVIKASLENLRYALIDAYSADKVLANARNEPGGHELLQIETLEETGETLKINLSIEISGGQKR